MTATILHWNKQGGRRYPQASSPSSAQVAPSTGGILTIPVVVPPPAARVWPPGWSPLGLEMLFGRKERHSTTAIASSLQGAKD